MKTITIDYELYKKELLQAKTDGFEVVKELKKEIDNILSALNSYSGKERDEAVYKMHVLYSKLSEIKE